jgi:hypothetical protein
MDIFAIYSPEKELEVLARLATEGKQVDWKPAIVLAAAYLEGYGAVKLKNFFEQKETKFKERFDRVSLPEINMFLYGLGLIKSEIWKQMNTIWKERLNIVHPKGMVPEGDYLGREANKRYAPMIKKAVEIMKILSGRGVKP